MMVLINLKWTQVHVSLRSLINLLMNVCSAVLHPLAPHPHRSGGCCSPHLFQARWGEWRHRICLQSCLFISFFTSALHICLTCASAGNVPGVRTGFSSMAFVARVYSGYQSNEGREERKCARGEKDCLELYKHTAPYCAHRVITLHAWLWFCKQIINQWKFAIKAEISTFKLPLSF